MATIQDKLFTDGFNLGAPLFVQGGVNGKYVVAANQIAWGENSSFNGATFGGTTVGLLNAIEAACAGIDSEQINQIIKDYLDENGVQIPAYYITEDELAAMSYITSTEAEKYIDSDELNSALAGKADTIVASDLWENYNG